MKKIIVILNESHIPQHVIQRAVAIAKETGSFLEAIFLNDIDYLNLGYPFPNDLFLVNEKLAKNFRTDEAMRMIRQDAEAFERRCTESGVEFKIEIDKNVSVKHLLDVSGFADLIITDSIADSDEYSLKDVLADAHCPVLLVSRSGEAIEKIFLAYDGTPSGMHAIKMFSYIFPELKKLPTQLMHFTPGNNKEIPHLAEIKTWAAKQFINLEFRLISGNARKELVEYIKPDSEKSLVVMGAYGRSSVSRLFLKSMAESVINGTDASLFISHE